MFTWVLPTLDVDIDAQETNVTAANIDKKIFFISRYLLFLMMICKSFLYKYLFLTKYRRRLHELFLFDQI